ncbi:MAG: hypothetical protein MUF80_05275 [Burkholderiales bacterium]|nr:hypothetical protein [Burkholderiales bacterium]
MLFTLWYVLPHRSTRDADLLGFGPSGLDSLMRTFRAIAGMRAKSRRWTVSAPPAALPSRQVPGLIVTA